MSDGTPGIATQLVASQGVAGAVEVLDSDADDEGTVVGYMGPIAGVNGEYGLIKANIG